MKIRKAIQTAVLAAVIAAAGLLAGTDRAHAAAISSEAQAQQKALQKVPNGTVTEVDRDHEKGELVYEVQVVKGSKKYDITYRASDAKIIAYEWEKIYVDPAGSKPLISESKCRQLALKKVKNGTILSLTRKIDDGVDIYKVKMTAGNKRYTLKFHGRTGALVDYEWELKPSSSSSSNNNNSQVSMEKAKNIALGEVPGGTVVKAEYDVDDGIPVYEIEIVKGAYEYEFKIHAKTGEILERDQDWND